MEVLDEIQTAIAAAVERVGPAVVGIGRGWGTGSGFVYAPGRVLTSAHSVGREEVAVAFAGGRRAAGRVAGGDPNLDVAVVDVDTGDVEPVEWPAGDPGAALGRFVLALADPGGRGLRATPGFVASAAASFRGPRGRRIEGAIEHTAPLPRGSSGGPLVAADGRLLGVNSVRTPGGLIRAVPAG